MVNGELGSTDNGKKVLINFRISLEEKKKLQAKAKQAHMSISSYIIALSENKKITVAENIPELLLEITRIGTNINQIAHIGNSQKYVKHLLKFYCENAKPAALSAYAAVRAVMPALSPAARCRRRSGWRPPLRRRSCRSTGR